MCTPGGGVYTRLQERDTVSSSQRIDTPENAQTPHRRGRPRSQVCLIQNLRYCHTPPLPHTSVAPPPHLRYSPPLPPLFHLQPPFPPTTILHYTLKLPLTPLSSTSVQHLTFPHLHRNNRPGSTTLRQEEYCFAKLKK